MRRDSLQVRLIQVSGIALVIGLVISAAVLVWVTLEVRSFSGDIAQSRSRLPTSVRTVLPAESGVLDHPQVTLVRYSSGVSRGVVLFSTVPGRGLAAFLTLPPSTQVGGVALNDLSVAQVIHALRPRGVRVTHVALIDPAGVGTMADALGGITVHNPIAFAARTPQGQLISFARGKLKLDGQRVALYVHAAITREPLEVASAAVLGGIVHALLATSGFQHMQSVGQSLAKSASTDLTDADVLGLVDLRMRGGVALECRIPRLTDLSNPLATSAISQVLGNSTTVAAPCHARRLAAAGLTPPVAVVRMVQRYGWHLFALGALILAALATAAAALLVVRWPHPAAPVRSAWPPLTLPYVDPDGSAEVVWSGQAAVHPAAEPEPATQPAASGEPAPTDDSEATAEPVASEGQPAS